MPVDRTSKLIAIIDDDEPMQDSLRDVNDGRGATFHFSLPTQGMESALAV